jgi:hypothetical protein
MEVLYSLEGLNYSLILGWNLDPKSAKYYESCFIGLQESAERLGLIE